MISIGMNFRQLRYVRETVRRGFNLTEPDKALPGMIDLYEL